MDSHFVAEDSLPTQQRYSWRLKFLFYLIIVMGFGVFSFQGFLGYQINPASADALICDQTGNLFTIITNIEKVERRNFAHWTNQNVFYPNADTLTHADHLYDHSLIGLPYYHLTRDPLNTYDFILAVQLVIAVTGYFFLARKLSGSLFAIICGALYFAYLPAFLDRHLQINLYGFLPWFVFFTLQLVDFEKSRYVYLASLAFLLQALAGVYLQLFLFTFTPLFLLVIVVYLKTKQRLQNVWNKKILIHGAVAGLLVGLVLFAVNKPYLDFHKKAGRSRTIQSLQLHAPDTVLGYWMPDQTGALYEGIFPSLTRRKNYEPLFIGATGVVILLVSWIVALFRIRNPMFGNFKNDPKILYFCLFLLFAMWCFSLGPFLKVAGKDTQIKSLYYYLYQFIPVFRSIRVTGRIIVVMALPLSILILWWCDEIQKREFLKGIRAGLLVFLTIFLFLDLYKLRPPQSDVSAYAPLYVYRSVTQAEGTTLLELPSGMTCNNLKVAGECWNNRDAYYLFTHLFHQKWLMNGSSGYVPEDSATFFRRLDRFYDDPAWLFRIFQQHGVSQILVHRDRVDPADLDHFRKFVKHTLSFSKIDYIDEKYLLMSVQPRFLDRSEVQTPTWPK